MRKNWQEKFRNEYIDYVNANIVFMELYPEKKDHINFEEEMEWIIKWFEKEING